MLVCRETLLMTCSLHCWLKPRRLRRRQSVSVPWYLGKPLSLRHCFLDTELMLMLMTMPQYWQSRKIQDNRFQSRLESFVVGQSLRPVVPQIQLPFEPCPTHNYNIMMTMMMMMMRRWSTAVPAAALEPRLETNVSFPTFEDPRQAFGLVDGIDSTNGSKRLRVAHKHHSHE